MANGLKGKAESLTAASATATVPALSHTRLRQPPRGGERCLVVVGFGEQRFRHPQEFRYWFDGEAWQVRGPFGIDFFSDVQHEVEGDVRDCLDMLWEVYVGQDASLLTGDALRLRDELLSAIE